jgi:hypothetical protein
MHLLSAAGDGNTSYWEIVEQAVEEWMRRHAQDHCGEPEFAGYQWKGLFLPHGTVLRTVFKGKNHHCRVECDQIVYNGKAHSPSGFVNAVGGVRRNAWNSVWLLFPDAKHWQLADALRAPKRPAAPRRARPAKGRPAAAARPEAQRAPTLPPAPASVRPSRPMAPASAAGERTPHFGIPANGKYRWSVRPASP